MTHKARLQRVAIGQMMSAEINWNNRFGHKMSWDDLTFEHQVAYADSFFDTLKLLKFRNA